MQQSIIKSLFVAVLIIFQHQVFSQNYVTDWPIQSLQPSAETLQQLEHQNDDIPYYLQNPTFRYTIYDTTTWQTLSDIEYRYIKALGNANSYYCVDIEILEDESVIIPWYEFNGDGLHITKVDSMGEEVYTQLYDNISSAQFHIYRKDTLLEFVGKFEINGKKRFGMLKYSLNTNDTISVTPLGNVIAAHTGDVINTFQLDTLRYILSTSDANLEDYIYIFNNTPELLDSIYFAQSISMIYQHENIIHVVKYNGNVYKYDGNALSFYKKVQCESFKMSLYKDGMLYAVNGINGILKLDSNLDQHYFARISSPGFAGRFPNCFYVTKDSLVLSAAGVNTSNWLPINEDVSIGLYLLSKEGFYLNKLYIGGGNFSNQQVFELKNGDYLFISNADVNQTGNGTIFLMRMKPWQDNVSVHDLLNNMKFKVYPNPATDKISIESKEITGIVDVKIYNITGCNIFAYKHNIAQPLNISNLQNGLYSIVITSNSNLYYSKFIKH